MFEKIKKLRIKFINFKEKGKCIKKNEQINIHKLKEVRTFSNSSNFNRNWIYKFFDKN